MEDVLEDTCARARIFHNSLKYPQMHEQTINQASNTLDRSSAFNSIKNDPIQVSMELISTLELSKKVFATISARGRPDKQGEISLVMKLNALLISFRINCFTRECVSGTLKATYDLTT